MSNSSDSSPEATANQNFWLLLSQLGLRLMVDKRNQLDVQMDDILDELKYCDPSMRQDMHTGVTG
jgi:hypothetical protein